MIKAMESGAGSISTTHAADAEAALRKLVTCAMEAGAHVTHDYATRAIAENIDIIVQLHLETTPLAGRRRPPGPVGVGDHHRHPGRAGQAATPPPTSSGRTGDRGRRCRGCCPMSTGSWSGTGSTCTASTPTPTEVA